MGGNRTQGTTSTNRNGVVFGLKSDTILNFDMPMTATTASSDTNNMLFKNQNTNGSKPAASRAHSNAPAPPSAH